MTLRRVPIRMLNLISIMVRNWIGSWDYLYDYSARQMDNTVPRFTSIDPMAEKKPWLSPYVYCSNNPENRIDTDGKDGIFNSKGLLSRTTNSGSEIYVNIGGKDILLDKLNLASKENRQIVANVIGHYTDDAGLSYYQKGMIPIGDNPIGTARLNENGDPLTLLHLLKE